MTFGKMGGKYLKKWQGKVLLIATIIAAVFFAVFLAETLASNTYIPKKGQSVAEKLAGNSTAVEDSAGRHQRSLSYLSLTSNLEEWISEDADLSKGIFCITTESYEYLVYNLDLANIADTGKTSDEYNYLWVDSGNDDFYAVVNIPGKNINLKDYYILTRDETGIYASRAIFNFYEAENVDVSNATVIGTILAPNASIVCENTSLYGQLQGKSVTGKIKFHKDIRFDGYRKIMDNLNVLKLKNDAVRMAAIEYLINNNDDGRYSDYKADSLIRVRDIEAVKKLSIHAPGVTYNSLEEDLAKFPNLEEVVVSGGVLPSFSLEKLSAVKALSITGTDISSLDISAASELERLILDSNKELKTLDFSKNNKIKVLSYSGTPLGWMDFSALPELYYLDCSNSNVASYLTISGEKLQNLKMLDISGNGNIQTFWIHTFPKLEKVNCSRCGIINLDFTGMTSLQYFKGSYNRFVNVDFKGAINLTQIEIYGESLIDIDIRGLKPTKVFCTAQIIQDEPQEEVESDVTEEKTETETEPNG